MSDHKANQRALLRDTLPPLLPVGYQVGVDIQLQVMPKVNVMLVPAGKMRTTGSGMIEILLGDPEEWKPGVRGVPQANEPCRCGHDPHRKG